VQKVFKELVFETSMKEQKDEKEKTVGEKKNDVIEIPIGKFFSRVRNNPWIASTLVLLLVLVFVIFFRGNSLTGNVVSTNVAGDDLISFINAQGKGNATLISIDQEGTLYKAVVGFQGQQIPVYVTLDGKYLVSQPIPLTGGQQPSANPGKVDVVIGDSPRKGSKDAKVTIVEFSDYQCPFCGKFYTDTYKQLVKDYVDTGKVQIIFKDFPLTAIHEHAQKAAEAARCAREQIGDTGYFMMHNKMFENQDKLAVDDLKKLARTLDIDGKKFDSCLDSGKYEQAVKDDEAYGQKLGVTGTPAFFINGQKLEGAQPYSAFKKIIDQELAA